jgi:hypothetical protein
MVGIRLWERSRAARIVQAGRSHGIEGAGACRPQIGPLPRPVAACASSGEPFEPSRSALIALSKQYLPAPLGAGSARAKSFWSREGPKAPYRFFYRYNIGMGYRFHVARGYRFHVILAAQEVPFSRTKGYRFHVSNSGSRIGPSLPA